MHLVSPKAANFLFAATLVVAAMSPAWAQERAEPIQQAEPTHAAGSGGDAQKADRSTRQSEEASQEEQRKQAAAQQAHLERIAENQALDHYELACYYSKHLNFKMAELELEAAIMYMPSLKVAHRDYCLVSVVCGHPLRAVAEMMMVVGFGEPIPLTEDEKTRLLARGARMHFHQGLAYGRQNRWTKAIAELKWALTYAPDNASIERWLAFSYARTGDFALAEKSYARVFNDDPSDGYSHADLAFLLSENGREDQAAQQLSEAVKLEPKVAALHVDMGWIAESKGDLPTAQREFRQAIQLSPKHAQLWTDLGRVLERQGNTSGAKIAYTQALAIDPQQDDAKQHLLELKSEPSKESPQTDSVEQSHKQS